MVWRDVLLTFARPRGGRETNLGYKNGFGLMIFVDSSMRLFAYAPLKDLIFFNIDTLFLIANLHHVMRYFSFLQYVMRLWGYRWRHLRRLCKKQQSLSQMTYAFDSASRQRRSRRRLAAFTSTQGSQKASRSLTPSQRCKKTCEKKSKHRRGRHPIGGRVVENR